MVQRLIVFVVVGMFLILGCAPVSAYAPTVATPSVDMIFDGQDVHMFDGYTYQIRVVNTSPTDRAVRPDREIPFGISVNHSMYKTILNQANARCSRSMDITADGAMTDWVVADITATGYPYRISLAMGEEQFNIGLYSACWYFEHRTVVSLVERRMDNQDIRTALSWGWAVVYVREGKTYEQYAADATKDWLVHDELMSAADYTTLVNSIPVGDLPVTFLYE